MPSFTIPCHQESIFSPSGELKAVAVAMEERLQRLRTEEKRRQIDMAWHLGQIQARYQHLAYRAGQPTDDELMYDDEGLPV